MLDGKHGDDSIERSLSEGQRFGLLAITVEESSEIQSSKSR